jgi:hypothetical protein
MVGSHFDWARAMFADQFEADTQGFVYRKHMRGAPIQVSAAERDRYIAFFDTFLKYGSWGLTGGILALAIFLVFHATVTGIAPSDMATYGGLGIISGAFMSGYYWAWNLPARELRGRGTVGGARSRAEIRRLFLAKLTYGQIAAVAGAGVILLLKAHADGDFFSGWNALWTGLAIATFVLSAIQAFRKWRFDQDSV